MERPKRGRGSHTTTSSRGSQSNARGARGLYRGAATFPRNHISQAAPTTSGKAFSMQPPRKSSLSNTAQQGNWQERYTKLQTSRKRERANAIRDGFIADPDKPRKLAEAITPVGTCQDMCAEFERVERVVQKDVWKQETDPANLAVNPLDREPDEARMVKKFRRAAAGIEEQLPSDLRPPAVLKQTCNYLFNVVVEQADRLADVHHFVWDRTRAIRNDFSIQQISKPEDLVIAVECYERIARFHILSLHQLALPTKPYEKYDWQQEREQLDRTLLSLVQYYEDSRGKIDLPNEAEFRAYCVIFQLQDPVPDLEDRVQSWPRKLALNPRVKKALQIYAAACTTNDMQGPLKPPAEHAIAQQDWFGFWRLIESKGVSYLMACVSEIYFNLVRRTVLQALLRSASAKVMLQWDIDEVRSMLAFDDDVEVEEFCERYDLAFKEVNGRSLLDLSVLKGKRLPDAKATATKQTKSQLVEQKRCGRTFSAVIDGLSVKQARDLDLIEEEESEEMEDVEDATYADNASGAEEQSSDDTLFVSQKKPAKSILKPTSAFGQLSTSTSPFASFAKPSAAAVNGTGFFGKPSASTSGIFGQSSATTNGKLGMFGQPSIPATSTTGVFGQPSAPIKSTAGVFGQPSAPPASSTSVFAQVSKPTDIAEDSLGKPSTSIFAQAPNAFKTVSPFEKAALTTPKGTPAPDRPSSLFSHNAVASPGDDAAGDSNRFDFMTNAPTETPTTIMPSKQHESMLPSVQKSPFPFNTSAMAQHDETQQPSKAQSIFANATLPMSLATNSTPADSAKFSAFDGNKQSIAPSPIAQVSTPSLFNPNITSTPPTTTPTKPTQTTTNSLFSRISFPPASNAGSKPFSDNKTTTPSGTLQDNVPPIIEEKDTFITSDSSNTRFAAAASTTTAKPAPLPKKEPDTKAILDQIALDLTLDADTGFLKQYVDFVLNQIVTEAQESVYLERIEKEAKEYRLYKLSTQYGLHWRDVCRRRRLARHGRGQRQRAFQRLQERKSQQSETSSVADSTATRTGKATQDINSKRDMVDKMFQQSIGSGRWSKLAANGNATKSQIDTSANAPISTSNKQVDSISRTISRIGQGGRIVKPNQPSPSNDTVRRPSRVPATPLKNTTKSNYFRRKALGLDVASEVSPFRQRKRGYSEMSSTSLVESPVASTPGSIASDATRDITSSDNAITKIRKTSIDDDALFARLRAARESLAEGSAFYQSELTKSQSPQSITPVSPYNSPSMDRARLEARQRQATGDVPAYRLRESKFVPREMYAKAVENARHIRESRSRATSRPESHTSARSPDDGMNGDIAYTGNGIDHSMPATSFSHDPMSFSSPTNAPAVQAYQSTTQPAAFTNSSRTLSHQSPYGLVTTTSQQDSQNTNATYSFGTVDSRSQSQAILHPEIGHDYTIRPTQIPETLAASFRSSQGDEKFHTNEEHHQQETDHSNVVSGSYQAFATDHNHHDDTMHSQYIPATNGDTSADDASEQEDHLAYSHSNPFAALQDTAQDGGNDDMQDKDEAGAVFEQDEYYHEKISRGNTASEGENSEDGDDEDDNRDEEEDEEDYDEEDYDEEEDGYDEDEQDELHGQHASVMNGWAHIRQDPLVPAPNAALQAVGNNETDAIELSD